MQGPPDTASLVDQVAGLQGELDSLRARYDTLLEAKNRAAERYKADYKKWRNFKRWLFQNLETDDQVKSFLKTDDWVAYTKASAVEKREQFDKFGPNVDMKHAGGETESPKQEFDCHSKVDLARSSPVPTSSKHLRRNSYHGEPSQKVFSLSPRTNKAPFLASQAITCGDELPVLDGNNIDMSHKAEQAGSSRSPPVTETRRRKGRYAQVPSKIDTINSRFSIRKDRNHGLDFQYDAVVREREERKHMLGSDCECCREYYEAVGPLPTSRQPLWRTPTKRKPRYTPYAPDNDKENTEEVEQHKQLISRHRHHWHRPKTPPGYWDIGFPDTQEVLDINQRAAEMHKRKLLEVEVEARNEDGRYARRAPATP